MQEYIMEEMWFFKYHLKCSRAEFMSYPVYERKWIIARFLEQKEKEQEAIDKAKKPKQH
jgi:hypothetical protein